MHRRSETDLELFSVILQDSTTANTSVDDLLTGPIRGELFTDKFTLGKTTLDQFEMAFIDSAWGEHHPTLSLCRELPKNEMLAYAMVAQGHTNSAAYSVILSEDSAFVSFLCEIVRNHV